MSGIKMWDVIRSEAGTTPKVQNGIHSIQNDDVKFTFLSLWHYMSDIFNLW